jgi:transposase
MQVLHPCCCGMDVHKKQVTACVLVLDTAGDQQVDIREFGTVTRELLRLCDWLRKAGVEKIAMESTGAYWRPVWNILEASGFSQMLVNARDMKAVPGRKTDAGDAEWIADLLQHGLLKASFVPSTDLRRLRDLTRMRAKLTEDHTRVVNRLQAVLEDANIKLASVVTDVAGISARAMLSALLDGECDAERLASLARGRMRPKIPQLLLALEGHFTDHHRFMVQSLLRQMDFLAQERAVLEAQIEQHLENDRREAVALWQTIPGVDHVTACVFAAEIGVRPEQFPDAHHLASWVGMCPGNNESAGKRKSGKTRHGNLWLRAALCRAAWAASHTKHTYLAALFRRLAKRRGRKRAIFAVGHAILVIAYQMLKTKQTYCDLGEDYFDRLDKARTTRALLRRLTNLGYPLSPVPAV